MFHVKLISYGNEQHFISGEENVLKNDQFSKDQHIVLL